ncbi:MAG: hypothetical protein ACRDPV_12160 [Gaiellaceae bacterium]
MNDFAATLIRVDTTASPAADWPRLGRVAAAATLVLGAACQLVSFGLIPDFSETAERLEWIADDSAQAQASKVFDVLAMPFLVGTAIVYLLLARRRSPRLAWAGGLLLVMGMVGLSMVQGAETLMYGLADDERFDAATLGAAVDDLTTPSAIVMLLLFLPGAFFGVILSSAALWRSRAVPRGAVLLLLLFLVVDIILSRGFIGHAVSFAAAVWIAVTVLRSRPAS